MKPFLIYLIDDESAIRRGIRYALGKHHEVRVFETAEEGMAAIAAHRPDLLLLDVGLPGMDGLTALRRLRHEDPDLMVIMVTAYDDVESVVAAMKLGAYDYIAKPFQMDTLRNSVGNALERIRLRKEVRSLHEKSIRENSPFVIGESDAVHDLMKIVNRVARFADAPVLLTGASGTGKEVIAKAIHYGSRYYGKPFVAVNCAAIPRELAESELFGYARGAFTGALAEGKRGLIEQAENGTLFLDEIGEINYEVQAKLLRFMDSGEFYKVGDPRPRKADCRIIAATNRPLAEMIEAGDFREDLYYRLSVVRIDIPSLAERKADILPFARHFLDLFSNKYGLPTPALTPEVEAALLSHPWRGNVRELKNAMERAVILGNGDALTPTDLGLPGPVQAATPQRPTRGPTLPEEGIDLEALEKRLIREALRRADGNDAQAAKLLNLSYYAFRYRKKKALAPTDGPDDGAR